MKLPECHTERIKTVEELQKVKEGLKYCSRNEIAPDGACPYGKNCEECDSDGIQVLKADALKCIEQLEQLLPKWNSVKNPPEKWGAYLVLIQLPGGKMQKSWDTYSANIGWCSDDWRNSKVIGWMPFDALPDMPKEGL